MNPSGIEWTDETWNPVTGCSKVSQGCKHCYAERIFARPYPGRDFTDVRCHPERLGQPLHMRKGRRIFVNSTSDLFHEAVPFQFIADVFAAMSCTTRHTYQILTKRPQRMLQWFEWLTDRHHPETPLQDAARMFGENSTWPAQIDATKVWPQWTPANANRGGYDNCGPLWPLENVWLGVSVEDQPTADERIPLLLQTPAAVRFISAEPLLGPISFPEYQSDCSNELEELDLVIAGGESGPHARPSHPDWFRTLRDQCAAADVPFFFKQWGEWAPGSAIQVDLAADIDRVMDSRAFKFLPPYQSEIVHKVGKKAAGRTLDGREHNELPA